ncbi:pyrroline-5-carboxylate reductase [Gemmobacter serpentinus]|uniref:pyrroline-5-carboxylate reductase n=1 Tax=Gemmobacter serpentinus TaxID=2652247 RepID=UPI00124C0885|nr:pyrroline-5-carboxylate reductase [Gemmobacter serpentinus]
MLDRVKKQGLVLLGCGKMGSALLEGWLKEGVPPSAVWVLEPRPSDWLQGSGVHLNTDLPAAPAIVLLAVKPQMMGAALPQVTALGGKQTLFLSIAAGTTIASFEDSFGAATPIIRAMPNTPAAVGRGITAIIGNARASAADLDLAEALLSAVGQVVRLASEDQIDAVTAVSGSGPAYVFHLIEALAKAGEAEGLPADMAMQLARATICGAGELAFQSPETAEQLRINVTSPGGTTAAGLAVLMEPETGFPELMRRAVQAAAARGRELGK